MSSQRFVAPFQFLTETVVVLLLVTGSVLGQDVEVPGELASCLEAHGELDTAGRATEAQRRSRSSLRTSAPESVPSSDLGASSSQSAATRAVRASASWCCCRFQSAGADVPLWRHARSERPPVGGLQSGQPWTGSSRPPRPGFTAATGAAVHGGRQGYPGAAAFPIIAADVRPGICAIRRPGCP